MLVFRGTRVTTLVLVAAIAIGPPGQAQEPRFRGGTNLVRLDVYVSANGTAVTDLAAEDFEVLEDNAPQTVSSFEFVRARGAAPDSARVEPRSVAESRSRAAAPDARAFVLFLDTLHVQTDGSYRAQNPVATLLDRIVGADDLIGVMTPEMTARNMTFSPRTASVGDMLRANWTWGERGSLTPTDPRETDLRLCYPDSGATSGVAKAVIERRREARTLGALSDLVSHLEGLREERTFVLLLTEGWTLPRQDERLTGSGRAPGGRAGGPAGIGVTPQGQLGGLDTAGNATQACERERSLAAMSDLDMDFQLLTRRANRANVSFYPIDPRGLTAFDDPIGPERPASVTDDISRMSARQNALRRLADETDGTTVLNTAIDKALPRLLTDIGSYYLLGYVSTNAKLDGRYRRLTVRVKRPGVEVRARPGYLAPSASDLAGAAAASEAAAAAVRAVPAGVSDALARLPVSRRTAAVYLQAAGGPGGMSVVVELDRTTTALPEWAKGGRVRVLVESAERAAGVRASGDAPLAAGARVQSLRLPDGDPLAPGRYQVRAEVVAEGARTPIVVSTVVDVPAPTALIGSALLASRRGPGTGRSYEPTADPRMRRTERLIVEVARLAPGAVMAARLLNRAGQSMQVPVTLGERTDEARLSPVVTGELALAPLAAGEYVLELTATLGDRTETLTYPIRVVP